MNPNAGLEVLKRKNIVHLPGIEHRMYYFVAYSKTDTISSLQNHISGPVHCVAADGLYSSLLLHSFCLFADFLLYRSRPTHDTEFDFFFFRKRWALILTRGKLYSV